MTRSMGDGKVACSLAIYAPFYEDVVAEIMEVLEREENKKAEKLDQRSAHHSPRTPIRVDVLATDRVLDIALGGAQEGAGSTNHRRRGGGRGA